MNENELRLVECCGCCEHGSRSYDLESFYCSIYPKIDTESFLICDSFCKDIFIWGKKE